MPLVAPLPLLPADARQVSDSLAIQRGEEHVVFFNAAGPIYTARREDLVGLRLGAQTAIQLGLAGVGQLAEALELHRTTLYRDSRRLAAEGVSAVGGRRRGPKGPRLLTAEILREAQDMLDRGMSMRGVASEVGVSEGTIRRAVRQGRLVRSSSRAPVAVQEPEGAPAGPSSRATEDQACEGGVAVKRTVDRAMAAMGQLGEAAPTFEAAEAVPGAGVLLALPALLHEGVIDVGEKVYGRLRNGFFGLRSILLTFAFMALLRIRTLEQITGRAPGEFGRLLGLDRAPEVKTLRRKLGELGAQGLAHTFGQQLTQRWAVAEPDELGVLYVDGHVRPYHGRTHVLPKLHVQQRGRPMPGTKDYHVNDSRSDPLFFVTAPSTEGLLEMLSSSILPQVRSLVGAERRVTIVFDREGWSPTLFKAWKDEGFDVITYRKGKQSRWQEHSFTTMRGKVEGRRVEYELAERRVKLSNDLSVREIRRLMADGHQTPIITTNEDLSTLDAAHCMFARWRQENFFRYMEQEFDLNHLCTNEVEPADPKRMVTCPARAALEKERAGVRRLRTTLIERRLDLSPDERARVGGKLLTEAQLDEEIVKTERKIDRLTRKIKGLPEKVTIDAVLPREQIVKLEVERKVLTDWIKLIGYRAESALARVLEPLLSRNEEEGRKFLQTVFQATADILPAPREKRLTVRFHGLASPRATRALAGLCAVVNTKGACYPGTDLRLHFEAPGMQK